jgi:O-acetyl-ADP-ribose deacetylase (regulator of RNase III)
MFAQPQDDALVDPVNCIGVSGKGLALKFKHEFPSAVHEYERWCKTEQARTGRVHCVATNDGPTFARYVVFFPTKTTWRLPSELSYVEDGLRALVELTHTADIRSLSVPSLGCGLGGLPWAEVLPLIEDAVSKMPSTVERVRIFAPQ